MVFSMRSLICNLLVAYGYRPGRKDMQPFCCSFCDVLESPAMTMDRRLLAILVGAGLFAALASPAAAQVEYAYTPLDLDKCRHKAGEEVEDYGEWRCAGYGGIGVHVSAGDQRVYVSFGRNAANELAARQTLRSFNGEGKTIEWRIETAGGKKRPFAAIMRWGTTVTDQNDKQVRGQVRGQVLVVTRLDPGGVCHVGYVDGRANPDANELARKIADEH